MFQRLWIYRNLSNLRAWLDSQTFAAVMLSEQQRYEQLSVTIIDEERRLPYLMVYDGQEFLMLVQPRQTAAGIQYHLIINLCVLSVQVTDDGDVPFSVFQLVTRAASIMNLSASQGSVSLYIDPIDPKPRLVHISNLPVACLQNPLRLTKFLQPINQELRTLREILAQSVDVYNPGRFNPEWIESLDEGDDDTTSHEAI